MNRMHVISIPYSLMKVNPLSWIQKVHTYKGECPAYSQTVCVCVTSLKHRAVTAYVWMNQIN